MFGYLEYLDRECEGMYGWLGKVGSGQDIEMFKNFIVNELTVEQQQELYNSIKNAFDLEIPEERE